MKEYTVDRIGEGIAVLLWRRDEAVQHEVPVEQLPAGVKEGDILGARIEEGRVVEARIDRKTRESQEKKIEDMLNRLLDKNR